MAVVWGTVLGDVELEGCLTAENVYMCHMYGGVINGECVAGALCCSRAGFLFLALIGPFTC